MTMGMKHRRMGYLLGTFCFIGLLIFALWPQGAQANGNPGAIWTTRNNCGSAKQDVNHYAIGEDVYINGANFTPGSTYSWSITGRPGQASEDPGAVVKSGSYKVDQSGAFCFAAYTVADDDGGEYQVKFGTKGDNYRVDRPEPTPTVEPTQEPPAPTQTSTVQPTETQGEQQPPAPTQTSTVQPTETQGEQQPPAPTQTSESGAPVQPSSTVTNSTPGEQQPASQPELPSDEPASGQPEISESVPVATQQPQRSVPASTAVVLSDEGARPRSPEQALVPAMLPVTASTPDLDGQPAFLLMLGLGLALLAMGLLIQGYGRRQGARS